MSDIDCYRPFLFERLDVRGAFVRLGPAWQAMLAGRGYPAPVLGLLGETAAVSVLIAANLKQPGRLTFQVEGSGVVQRLVLDCDERLRLRGMAQHDPVVPEGAPDILLGDGQLLLTLDSNRGGAPYQSRVPLDGSNMASIFQHYLERSEQQPAHLLLAADGRHAGGLFLQKLPGADRADADGWQRLGMLADTLRCEELLTRPVAKLLTTLFPEEDIRLFDARPVAYHCPEDWEKVRGMLQSLGLDECRAILGELGEIAVRDDICNHVYRFDAEAIEALFAPRILH